MRKAGAELERPIGLDAACHGYARHVAVPVRVEVRT
jgi:hypothetical protein